MTSVAGRISQVQERADRGGPWEQRGRWIGGGSTLATGPTAGADSTVEMFQWISWGYDQGYVLYVCKHYIYIYQCIVCMYICMIYIYIMLCML